MNLEIIIKKQTKAKIKTTLISLAIIIFVFIMMIFSLKSTGMWRNPYLIIIGIIYLPFIYQLTKLYLWNKKYRAILAKQLKKYDLKDIKIIEADIDDNALIKYHSPQNSIFISASLDWFILVTGQFNYQKNRGN